MRHVLLVLFCSFLFESAFSQNANIELYNSNTGKGFIENKGQIHDQNLNQRKDVLFGGETEGLTFFLLKNGVSYQQIIVEENDNKTGILDYDIKRKDHAVNRYSIYRTDIVWSGINKDFTVVKKDALPLSTNFYISSCPDGATNVKTYQSVLYQNLYDNIDLNWHWKNGSDLEYDFIIHPGADCGKIKWKVEGVSKISLSEYGELIMTTPYGEIREAAPIAFQGNNEITVNWVLVDNVVSFEVGKYDRSLDLIIDPIVKQWGTYFGGNYNDYGHSTISDAGHNVYLSGYTSSITSIATVGSHQSSHAAFGWTDAFVVKFNTSGVRQWATYYGGGLSEFDASLALDGNSNLYLVGYTESLSGIATTGSQQSSFGGGAVDGYLVKFNGNGVRQWATYLGGSGDDWLWGCSIDQLSNVYVCGQTQSDTGIATPGAFKTVRSGIASEALLAKFDSSGNRIWSTYYGGTSSDDGRSCKVSGDSNIYLMGYTNSANGIATTGSHQSTYGGSGDSFLAKFNSNGSRIWGTYFGGSNDDPGEACAVDALSNVYIVGHTNSTNNISSTGSHQSSHKGGFWDGYVAKLNANGVKQWSTYYGGTANDLVYGCVTDASNNFYLIGATWSTNFISTLGSPQPAHGGSAIDAFFVKFNPSGTRQWGTYYGGTGNDYGFSIDVDNSLNVYVAGRTYSNFAMGTIGSHQSTKNNSEDAFVAKFDECSDLILLTERACDQFLSPSGNKVWKTSGNYSESFINGLGCDSIINVNLTIDTVNNGVMFKNDTIKSLADSAIYQWIECSNDSLIDGETNQTFVANENGEFAVIVVSNTCTDTSECITISGIGINEVNTANSIKVYPNPIEGKFVVDFTEVDQISQIELFNLLGEKIPLIQSKFERKILLDMNGKSGMYVLRIKDTKGNEWSQRIIKK